MGKPLLFNGKSFDPKPPKEVDLRLKNWLDDNYGVWTKGVIQQHGVVSHSTVYEFSRNPLYKDYVRLRPGTKFPLVLGSPKALKEYDKTLAELSK